MQPPPHTHTLFVSMLIIKVISIPNKISDIWKSQRLPCNGS